MKLVYQGPADRLGYDVEGSDTVFVDKGEPFEVSEELGKTILETYPEQVVVFQEEQLGKSSSPRRAGDTSTDQTTSNE